MPPALRDQWEDDDHVAFLTPFPNTPGFTVLVPRKHLVSDIFAIEDPQFSALMVAAHKVAGILKQAFKVEECGMIFEGFEIDYAHVKLTPIHQPDSQAGLSADDAVKMVAPFVDKYEGFVSSLGGSLAEDFEAISHDVNAIRQTLRLSKPLSPPKSWNSPSQHLSSVLHNQWYKHLFILQNILFHNFVEFFHKRLGYRFCFVPTTTDSPSSPMGLGSDSEPVPVSLLGQQTFLADSMQFALENFLRIQDGTPGVYYLNTSFRGEDPDSMHLNQFFHVECELLGSFAQGISVAEQYVANMVTAFIQDGAKTVERTVGSLQHLESFMTHYRSHGNTLPQITIDDALKLPVMDSTCWKAVVETEPTKGRALTRAGEVRLIEHFGGAVWLTEMDHLSVPFYQAFVDETCAKGRCADLLLGNGEVLGLGERHKTVQEVHTALEKHQVDPQGYAWYTEMRKHKPVLTTGWGMGIERFLAWAFSHNDIRDLTVVPRMKGYTFVP